MQRCRTQKVRWGGAIWSASHTQFAHSGMAAGRLTWVLTKSSLSFMETLPTATPMHSTFFSWNLTEDLISFTCRQADVPGNQVQPSCHCLSLQLVPDKTLALVWAEPLWMAGSQQQFNKSHTHEPSRKLDSWCGALVHSKSWTVWHPQGSAVLELNCKTCTWGHMTEGRSVPRGCMRCRPKRICAQATHLGLQVVAVGDQRRELARLVQAGAQQTWDLLDHRLRGDKGCILLGCRQVWGGHEQERGGHQQVWWSQQWEPVVLTAAAQQGQQVFTACGV